VELSHPLAVVTPTLDGDVLAAMAQREVSFTTGQLHRILPRYSEAGIRKVLRRLTRQGIVDSERVGNAFNYRFNREHLAAGPIMELATLQRTLLSRIEERLQSWAITPVYAALFDSAASINVCSCERASWLPGTYDQPPATSRSTTGCCTVFASLKVGMGSGAYQLVVGLGDGVLAGQQRRERFRAQDLQGVCFHLGLISDGGNRLAGFDEVRELD